MKIPKSRGKVDLASLLGSIKSYQPHWFQDRTLEVAKTKEKLLEMARRGDPRPKHRTLLGGRLGSATVSSNGGYDPVFDLEIRRLAPSWFRGNISKDKEALLEMASRAQARPKNKTRLGGSLSRAVSKGSAYDETFHKKIRELAPHWLWEYKRKETRDFKKLLLRMAKKGDPRPRADSLQGKRLAGYCSRTHSQFDKCLFRKLKGLVPQWFTESKSALAKAELLEMAAAGDPKPVLETLHSNRFRMYAIRKGRAYDPIFAKKIRQVAPHWFFCKRSKDIEESKKLLLLMAKKGEPKPKARTLLHSRWAAAVGRGHPCYDHQFDSAIRQLAPHWFSSHKVAERESCKKLLLDMAARKEPRPTKGQLKNRLAGFTCRSTRYYDEQFSEAIRRMVPQWFAEHKKAEIAERKKLLLNMAETGKPRPPRSSSLANTLQRFITKSKHEYDAVFDSKVRSAAPHWFRDYKKAETYGRKQELLRLAREGGSRPPRESTLAKSLVRYVHKSGFAYDEALDIQLRALAPNWFRT